MVVGMVNRHLIWLSLFTWALLHSHFLNAAEPVFCREFLIHQASVQSDPLKVREFEVPFDSAIFYDARPKVIWIAEGGTYDELLGGQGFISFLRPQYGYPYRPGEYLLALGFKNGPKKVASTLTRFMLDQYPRDRFNATYVQLNRKRIAEAIRAHPFNPDFSRVPGLNNLGRNYELYLGLTAYTPNRILLLEVEVTFHTVDPQNPKGGIWVNKDQTIRSGLYQRWVDAGADAPGF